jgi:hypothetical protein
MILPDTAAHQSRPRATLPPAEQQTRMASTGAYRRPCFACWVSATAVPDNSYLLC